MELNNENHMLKTKLETSEGDYHKKLKSLDEELVCAQGEISKLKDLETTNAISMAETKATLHTELEEKEIKCKEYSEEIMTSRKQCSQLQEKLNEAEELCKEFERKLKVTSETAEEEKKAELSELARGKSAALELLKNQLQERLKEAEEDKEKAVQENTELWENR